MSTTVLTQVFLQNQNDVIGFFHNRLHCPDTARDLAQEVYLRLERADQSKAIKNHRSYIFTVARNLLKDHVRNETRRSQLLQENQDILRSDGSPSAETAVIARNDLAILKDSIDDIPLKSRQIFYAHRFQKKTRRQIAKDFNVSLSTVENHLCRVLNHFSKALEQAGNKRLKS